MIIAKPAINIDKPKKYFICSFSYSWDCRITLLDLYITNRFRITNPSSPLVIDNYLARVTHFQNCLLEEEFDHFVLLGVIINPIMVQFTVIGQIKSH